jgi:hypothetical protein
MDHGIDIRHDAAELGRLAKVRAVNANVESL